MQGFRRTLGLVLVAAGILVGAWAITVWQWQDPFTALYTHFQQQALARQYAQRLRAYDAGRSLAADRSLAAQARIAAAARAYRLSSKRGQAIGWITIPRMGVNMVLVNGTDEETLKNGPGRDLRSFMPGENRLVYIAGHRTTYLAPFAHIDELRKGDRVTIRVPYGTFIYSVTGHRIVVADDLSVLRSPNHEELRLQACHPRFFATHRYIAYARLLRVIPRG